MTAVKPNKLGRYRLLEELGRGNSAVVYRGFDTHIQRDVAIKLPLYKKTHQAASELLAEARSVASLSHPNIITVFDVGVIDNRPFIAMELLEGVSLEQFVAQRRQLALRTILKIAMQLADALNYAHQRGIVHADVKPGNIAVLNDAADIKLMDFGIAQRQDRVGELQQGYVAGTPNFMSPEQIADRTLDGRTDLFSVGVVLYWLLSGRTPFRESDNRKLLSKIANEDAPRLQPRDLSTPTALIDLVHVLLQRDRNSRYQTGSELLEHLRVIDDQLARQERVRGGRRIIPLRWRWSVVMGGLVALTMALGVSLVQGTQSRVMHDLVFDYGSTLAQVIAAESAEDMLLEDQLSLAAQVRGMQANQDIVYLTVLDRHGQVVAADDPAAVGSFQTLESQARLLAERGEIQIYQLGDKADLLIFRAPIRFQEHLLGHMEVGVSTAALDHAARISLLAMLALFAVTLIVVLFGVFWLARRLQIPLDLLQRAMRRTAAGQLDQRIRLTRRDEFARLFASYNAMADSIEARLLQARAEQSQSGNPVNQNGTDRLPAQPPSK